ncbi:MAG TPA: 3-phosphoserine/phosphohydroxythreonine transaminase [Chitinophagaceae bacterium]|nr:3-phosphoserine/phosphohydroxythreonine transaminase [Chitinophagaceae bacterium]
MLPTSRPVVHNFNAGPAILPPSVCEEASRAILNYNDTGLSILEIGHRTPLFQVILDEARGLVKELMDLGSAHEVLFLHGGASTQFMQVPMNLLDSDEMAAYTDTGLWATKAIREARLFGHVEVACSSKEDHYRHLPKSFDVPGTAKYLHITTNNTVYGTQWQDLSLFYQFGVPLVADMSSDILSRRLPFSQFDLIYAGAQKNLGAAGVNLVIVNKNILGKVKRAIPTMMDYRAHIENGSLLNTPPVFAIYVSLLTLRWIKAQGGVPVVEQRNAQKAALLYETLDSIPLFHPTVAREDRSLMNVVFTIEDPLLEKEFLEICRQEGMIGIRGHRTVGGFRISLYNALPVESVQAITGLMKEFAQKKG